MWPPCAPTQPIKISVHCVKEKLTLTQLLMLCVNGSLVRRRNHKTSHGFTLTNLSKRQECIPVGCVPAARRPYAGVCFQEGGCLLREGVCSGGVSAPGGWGVCLLPGGIPACTEAEPPREQNDKQV